MSTTALPKLEELISDLDRQEEEVSNQLEAVRAKLEAVRAVLPLFDESAETTSVKTTSVKTKSKTSTAKSTAKTTSKASSSSTKAKATNKATKGKSKKKDGRAASWQKYTRPGVKNQSIPDAVKLILSTQPDKEFKIAEVMAALFKDNMPKTQYLKARNRVSNVLSGGVRAGDWYRGGRSTYRMSAS
ncbi:MAG: hypothetical protein AAF703_14315 [Cyanobacteria bacterium P01_D01_bin.105]